MPRRPAVAPRSAAFAVLVGASVLSNTVLIPAVRPLLSFLHGTSDGVAHAFMSINMLGGAIGAPLLAAIADRTGARRAVVVSLAVADGLLLLACTLPLPIPAVLGLRALQGAASIGALSVLMGSPPGEGPARSRAMALAGAASMAGVALGAPVGTALLRAHPTAPLLGGAVLALAVALSVVLLEPGARSTARAPSGLVPLLRATPLLRLPVAWVTIERFGVGCMVVSFSLYAHRVLGVSDARIGALYGWFLLPFVALTYPAIRLGDGRARAALVAGGLIGYASALVLLGTAPEGALEGVMLLGGVSSAAVYGPSLGLAVSLAPDARRSSAMALLHAGGSAGMLLGTALAGIASAALARAGWGPERSYPLVFALAGLAQLVALAGSARGLCRVWRDARERGGRAPDVIARGEIAA